MLARPGVRRRTGGAMDSATLTLVTLVLAETFRGPRSVLVDHEFPDSVLRLYDRATTDPRWDSAPAPAERAYILLGVLAADPSLLAALEADESAGQLGLGGGGGAALGGGEDAEFERELTRLTQMAGKGIDFGVGAEPPPPIPHAPPPERGWPDEPDAPPEGDGGQTRGWHEDPAVASDGLLGGDEAIDFGVEPLQPPEPQPLPPPSVGPPPSVAPPAPLAPPEPQTVETWLNADLEDTDTSQPLEVGREYVLSLSFGAQSTGPLGSAAAMLTFAPQTDHLDLTIRLLSAEFDTPPLPQAIRVRRNGTSVGRALFPITPKKAGPAVLTAMVDVEGNFVQQLVMRFDVAGAPAADVQLTNLGRPAGAAAMLGPREASLRFTPAVGGYKLFAPGVTADEVFVQITPDELAAAIEQVRAALLSIVKNETFALGMDIPAELGGAALKLLAFAGYRLYQRIFEGPFAPPELRAVGAWLRDTLSEDVVTLQVVSSGFPVPWALVYLAERWDESALDWGGFIGMRHVVEQVPMREMPAVAPPTRVDSTPALAVRVLYNDGIDAQMPSHPVAAQRAYWGGRRGIALTEGTTAFDLLSSALAPGSTDKLLYLYCHAVASNTNPDDSNLVLTGREKVARGALSESAPTSDVLTSHPLVFVNACESG